uniref:STAS domain-containing protein n=1 Tax=Parascaris univalens TaxID=6257 RepID=A0A915BYJ3_PARUN
MNQEAFEERYRRRAVRPSNLITGDQIKSILKPSNALCSLLSFFPILQWLPKYQWRKDLSGDIIGGLTVGIMHVPQGMAYASLASLPPVYGMYSSFFASTVYMFFGTSRHISIGVFAVASMMVGAVRLRLLPDPEVIIETINGSEVETTVPVQGPIDLRSDITPVALTSALAFGVGCAQLTMGVLRLGFLTTYMSDALVSGFTTGSAFHVFIAQLNKVIGVKLPRHGGFGMLFLMVRDLILLLPQSNYVSIGLSIFGIAFLSIGRDYVNPWFKKRSPVPLPLELILVIIATVFSVVMNLKTEYHVKVVDYIPQGVPMPSMPRIDLLRYMIGDCIAVGIVSYMFVISMAKLFAKKRRYKIDPGQELYAVGFMSLFSSFFPVYPSGASLSRSAVCEGSGVNTQLYTLFSSSVLLAVIIWIGPLLQPLPMCILACIVMVSLKSLFLQFRLLPRIWKISKFDFMVWTVSCLATVASDVMTGLTISVAFTLISVVLREQWPKIYSLGRASDYETYKPEERYEMLKPFGDNVKVLRFEAPLHFANITSFMNTMNCCIHLEANENSKSSNENANCASIGEKSGSTYKELSQKEDPLNEGGNAPSTFAKVDIPNRTIIVDCGAISYIDTMGLDAFQEVYMDGSKVGVDVYFANVSEAVLDILGRVEFFVKVPKSVFFPTVHQAVMFAASA